MARYSLIAWQAMIEASWTMSRVRGSRLVSPRTSSKAKLSKTSMSSGSVTASVDTWSGKSSSWLRMAVSLIAMVILSVRGKPVVAELSGGPRKRGRPVRLHDHSRGDVSVEVSMTKR